MHRHGLFAISLLSIATFGFSAPAVADQPIIDLAPMAAPPAVRFSDLAPMDEEFGRYHLTPLGIGNAITAAGARFGEASSRDELGGGSFALAIDAIHAWEHAYPRDPLIARSLARVAHVYARLRSTVARDFAERTVAWLEADFPGTEAALAARGELETAYADAVAPAGVDDSFANLAAAPPPAPMNVRDSGIPSYATPLSDER